MNIPNLEIVEQEQNKMKNAQQIKLKSCPAKIIQEYNEITTLSQINHEDDQDNRCKAICAHESLQNQIK
ncbi:unnamed protein product [Paramecium primaurelia]|uniref:Uncharacterized protein n=1 Tax=Paramecium primaurelia TaxID=5886 RepID=A0A8S1QK37_PARPR|nr:unnamed protein product [Paramecium primaurelia]CAD8116055.1 unnamed protein product [Paramecium primaurelia]